MNYLQQWKSDRQFFSFWFCLKMRTIFELKMFWIFKIRNPIRRFFNKFKKKKYYENGYCYVGTNGTPTTFGFTNF